MKTFIAFLLLSLSSALSFSQDTTGTVVILSDKIGPTIDLDERNLYRMLMYIENFESAVLLQRSDGSYLFKIITKNVDQPSVKIRWISVLAKEVEHIQNHIVPKSKAPFEASPTPASTKIFPLMIRVDYGNSEIHRPESDGRVTAFHVSCLLEHRGLLSAEGGIVNGSADEGFYYFDLGLELHPLMNFPLSPFVSAGGGYLHEPEWSGEVLRFIGGVDINPVRQITFRFAFQRGTHHRGTRSGPHLLTIGLGLRLGRRK